MKIYSGKAKVKGDSNYIYKGCVLDIIGISIEYKNGSGCGVFADGSREYRLSLTGTEFEKHGITVIHDSDLDIIELKETTNLPFDFGESVELLDYIRFNDSLEREGKLGVIIEEFIKKSTTDSIIPISDLTTIYDEDEFYRRNKTKC